jgi:5-methyltetrahydrofolate--homocysteine methyltransferase
MHARAVWRFFRAGSDEDRIVIFDGEGSEMRRVDIALPRQAGKERLCLADYVRPLSPSGTPTDNVALFIVSAGDGIRARYERYKADGEYLFSHAIQALALETAEAAAEWLHHKLRGQWGFPDPDGVTMLDRFQAHYRGKRYSFGYPACPDLALQRPLFDLLSPAEIGVALTDELMMDPEASVSAIVLHHPEAKYFAVGKEYLE